MKRRQKQGWEIARNSAEIIKKQFGFKRNNIHNSVM